MTIRAAPTPSPASAPATIVVNTARLRHNVVILASPSRRKTGLLQRQVTRALDSIDGDDSHAQAPPAADDDSGSSSSNGGNATSSSGVTVQSPSARKMRVGGAANGHVVYQISPNAVKRKRSHSMANVPGATQPHGEVEDLRVSIDLIDKNATGSRKRSGKSREGCGRVTPSKRCGGKDKKKPKVDVIERALKRFRANRHHDADRSFEFTSVCNLSAHDDAFGDSTPVASQRRGRSDSSCCNGNVDQSAEGSESTLVRVQVGVSDEDAIDIVRARFDDYRQANAVEPSSTSMMQFAADALVERALAKRSMDNITAMVIGFSPFSRDLFREDAAPDGAIRI
ncbi:hypothetical protein P43SY_006298 [Pythium insidiosum]|uniref:Uncharacterized protein n=1 Tax=Pythium insidiosum TaxID=114742 RepID=A0AAD5QC25_PYTIN|nr:hypothetical protein P43SY_006298 [Pythium insidiosum]